MADDNKVDDKDRVGFQWIRLNEHLPPKSGEYLTFSKRGKYEYIGFTLFVDGEFVSSSVSHWIEITKPFE